MMCAKDVTMEPAKVKQYGGTAQSRLYPPLWSEWYWHLTTLRHEIEVSISRVVNVTSRVRVVDFGCGDMPYRCLWKDHLLEYLGCDFADNESADVVINSNTGTLPLSGGSFDVAFSTQVLEHVVDPGLYLKECNRLLKPGGFLLLSTHGVWPYHPCPTDYWRWTSAGLKKIVSDAAFEIIHFRGMMGPPAFALQILQYSLLYLVPKPIHPLLTCPMQVLIRIADTVCPERVRNQDACTYFVLARKSL